MKQKGKESKEKMTETELHKKIIEVCLKIAHRGEGGLIILGKSDYKPLVQQDVPPFNILKNPKLLESLTLMDGAVIINKEGVMVAYGVKVPSGRILKDFGTRHSAGITASLNKENTVYLISEEDRKVKVFKAGKLLLQIDPFEKGIEKNIPETVQILESVGVGTLGTIGAGLVGLGITFMPGVIVFGGAYYLIKKIKENAK